MAFRPIRYGQIVVVYVRALISLKCRKTLEQTIPGLVRFETSKLVLSCDVLPLIPTLFTPKVVLTSLHHPFALKRSRDSLSLFVWYDDSETKPNLFRRARCRTLSMCFLGHVMVCFHHLQVPVVTGQTAAGP